MTLGRVLGLDLGIILTLTTIVSREGAAKASKVPIWIFGPHVKTMRRQDLTRRVGRNKMVYILLIQIEKHVVTTARRVSLFGVVENVFVGRGVR